MKIFFYLCRVFTFIVILVAASCGNKNEVIAYNNVIYAPQYASGFEIKCDDDSVDAIIISNPWQGADDVSISYRVETPAKRIIAMSSTYVAMLERLGAIDRIVGVSGIDFISSPAVNQRRSEIADVGYDTNIDFEKIIMLNPDLVLLYGVNGSNIAEDKLKELDIPYIYLGDYVEQSPLGKAEWIIAIGEIIGCRDKAIEIFNGIAHNYNTLKNEWAVSEIRPKVMLNAPYNDIWWIPSADNYMAQLVADAGGEYLGDNISGNSSLNIDIEEAYLMMTKADVWLNPGQATSLQQLSAITPHFTDTPPFDNGKVYNNNLRITSGGGNDFYESGVIHPDLILRDLIYILHPERMSGYEPTYYRQLN